MEAADWRSRNTRTSFPDARGRMAVSVDVSTFAHLPGSCWDPGECSIITPWVRLSDVCEERVWNSQYLKEVA